MTNLVRSNFQDHPFHLVSPSPWPFYTSVSLFAVTVNGALSMHSFSNSYIIFYLSLFTFFMLILVTGSNYLVMFVGLSSWPISTLNPLEFYSVKSTIILLIVVTFIYLLYPF